MVYFEVFRTKEEVRKFLSELLFDAPCEIEIRQNIPYGDYWVRVDEGDGENPRFCPPPLPSKAFRRYW